jgi:hypothetical protein
MINTPGSGLFVGRKPLYPSWKQKILAWPLKAVVKVLLCPSEGKRECGDIIILARKPVVRLHDTLDFPYPFPMHGTLVQLPLEAISNRKRK